MTEINRDVTFHRRIETTLDNPTLQDFFNSKQFLWLARSITQPLQFNNISIYTHLIYVIVIMSIRLYYITCTK